MVGGVNYAGELQWHIIYFRLSIIDNKPKGVERSSTDNFL